MTICLLNSGTSILAGFAIFSILGNISLNQGKNITEVVTEGDSALTTTDCLLFLKWPNRQRSGQMSQKFKTEKNRNTPIQANWGMW